MPLAADLTVPLVVTATTASGAPAAAYPMTNVGVVAPTSHAVRLAIA